VAGEQALGERFARSIGRGCACRELTVEEEHRGLPVWSVAAGIAAQKRRDDENTFPPPSTTPSQSHNISKMNFMVSASLSEDSSQ